MSDVQSEMQALLPFWANGTLTGPEREQVEAALSQSADLRAEAQALLDLRDRVKSVPRPEAAGEFGLARLMRSIAEENGAPALPPTAATPGLSRLRPYLALAATAAFAAVLASALTQSLMKPADPFYEQASGEDPTLTVAFQPDTTAAQIAAVLRAGGLAIVDGPSSLGLYRLAVPYDTTLDAAATALLASSDVILSVEVNE
jgi:hypothetical protein